MKNSSVFRLVFCVSFFASFYCSAQTWNIQLGKAMNNSVTVTGTVTLSQDGDGFRWKMISSRLNECDASTRKAAVERTERTLTVIPEVRFPDCPLLRYVINLDGSGGTVEMKQGEGWIMSTTRSIDPFNSK